MPASRAVEETRMPARARRRSAASPPRPLDLGERLAEPHDDARHAAVAHDQVGAEPQRHHRHRRIETREEIATRSSDIRRARTAIPPAPPALNQTSGASGAASVSSATAARERADERVIPTVAPQAVLHLAHATRRWRRSRRHLIAPRPIASARPAAHLVMSPAPRQTTMSPGLHVVGQLRRPARPASAISRPRDARAA